MKKVLYCILLLAELLVGILLMISLWSNNMYSPCVITAVAFVALLTWQIILLTQVTEPVAKRRVLRNIALIMLIPSVSFVIVFVYVAVGLIIALL